MEKKSCFLSKWNSIWIIIKEVYGWICFILVVLSAIAIVCQFTYQIIKRYKIKQDPVRVEATITHIGESTRWIGPTIYFDYQVKKSIYHGQCCPGSRTAKQLHVGQKIIIEYENGNPSKTIAVW